ncbi:MAG: DUF1653 domain-containing protein [Candidatus Woesearchaeota archaeon]|jgi:hypothetical protein
MNNQPVILNGYYLHYKKMPYQLVDMSTHSDTLKDMVTYQALYISLDFQKRMRWQKEKEEFFKDVEVDGKIVPRFTFVGTTIDELTKALKDVKSECELVLK